jgi:hypothetical protein
MTKQLKTRRDALREIVGAVAAAAGLSELEVGELLAQVQKVPDLARLAKIHTTDNAVKALKVLLAPKGQGARVFESEFGRKPALKPLTDPKTGQATCTAYLGTGTSCLALGCGVVVCNALGRDYQAGGGRELPGPGNVSSQSSTGFNKTEGCIALCNGQLIVPKTAGARINPQWLGTVRNDPYIKALMREYGVDTAEGLETQLTQALAERRAGAETVVR